MTGWVLILVLGSGYTSQQIGYASYADCVHAAEIYRKAVPKDTTNARAFNVGYCLPLSKESK